MDDEMLEELTWIVENSESVNGLSTAPMPWSKVLALYCPKLRDVLGYTPDHSDGDE